MKARRLPQKQIVFDVLENFPEIIWGEIASGASCVKRFIKTFIESLLEDELSALLSADRYERSPKRKGYRNGHYLRSLLTKFGLIQDIHVPVLRKMVLSSAFLTSTIGADGMWMPQSAFCSSMVSALVNSKAL